MASRPLDDEDTLDLEIEDVIEDEPEAEVSEDEAPEEDEDEDGVSVSFGDDVEAEQLTDSDLVKHLRKQLREARKTPAPPANDPEVEIPVLGPEPTMESCDYDEDRFKQETRAWVATEAKIEALKGEQERKKTSAAQQWQATWTDFAAKRDALKAHDFEDAETEVVTSLSKEQQLIIVGGAANAAAMIYALGKNPTKRAELAAITDPLKFAVALGKLEKDLKVVNKRKPPPVQESVRGSAPLSASSDKKLEQLEKEADRTGNRTKVIAYQRELEAKRKR